MSEAAFPEKKSQLVTQHDLWLHTDARKAQGLSLWSAGDLLESTALTLKTQVSTSGCVSNRADKNIYLSLEKVFSVF